MMKNCILNEKNKLGCDACSLTCAHRIALQGIDGKGGRVSNANVPQKYRGLTLSNSPASAEQKIVYEKAKAYVHQFKGSLYLFSSATGTGKTTTASAIINEFIAYEYVRLRKLGEHVPERLAYFLDVNEWQTLYNGFSRAGIPKDIAERNSRIYYTQMENARHAPFAVLDDIGVRSASEAFRSDLHTIINYRVANSLPTVYTSNIPLINATKPEKRVDALKPYDMMDVFDVRLLDRMRENCEVLSFEGKSKRGVVK